MVPAGLVLAPMSYAPNRAQGLAFVPSMALGECFATLLQVCHCYALQHDTSLIVISTTPMADQ